jgi:thymidylate synthase (FAD)
VTDKIDVLDHGYVRLIDSMGGDLSVVRAARVSYDADWRAGEDQGSDKRLINYLWRNKHTSPFEAVTFTFEVKAPMFVFRQWHRHRTWSFSELSARYRELHEEFYVPDQENVGVQSKDNKQGRDIGVTTHSLAPVHISLFCEKAFRQYRQLLNEGVPRELARSVLPLATYSHMFATVDLLNLMKFWSLRSDPHAQYEIRVYSDAMRELVKPIVPVCIDAWEAGRNAA